jgi:hypothetical protein
LIGWFLESEIDRTTDVHSFVFRLTELGEITMFQCLLGRETLRRIEEQQFLQQVDRLRGSAPASSLSELGHWWPTDRPALR